MPKEDAFYARRQTIATTSHEPYEESQSLLANGSPEDDEFAAPLTPLPANPTPKRLSPSQRRQSSLSASPANGAPRTPRTANRVRFDVEDLGSSSEDEANGQFGPPRRRPGTWMEEEDYMSNGAAGRGGRGMRAQRTPLLTGIEAPSVTVATDGDSGVRAEDLLESARPKSGMASAFMNMANSIM